MAGNALGTGLPDPLLPDPSNPMASNYTLADAADFWKQNAADTYAAIKNPQTWVDGAHAYAQGMLFGTTAPGEGNFLAYHGSPHSFDRFSSSKIGTGEGAQAYGHGLYFADNEAVAKSYRDALSTSPLDRLNIALTKFAPYAQGGPAATEANLRSVLAAHSDPAISKAAADDGFIRDVATMLRGHDYDSNTYSDAAVKAASRMDSYFPQSSGSMYQVNIAASPEHMLDWDKPLSEQSQYVQDALQGGNIARVRPTDAGYVVDYRSGGGDLRTSRPFPSAEAAQNAAGPMTARLRDWTAAHRDYTGNYQVSPEDAAMLRDAGIPGIRYLDASSRAAGEGSRNTVVFDDKLISILRKYGIAGLFLGGGAAGAASGGGQSTE